MLVERAGVPHEELQIAPSTLEDAQSVLRGDDWPARKPLAATPAPRGSGRLLRRIGVVDPESIDSYRSAGGYSALRRALQLGSDGVIRELTEAKLLGRGGAAFPTGRKWDAVTKAPVRPHYLVCNADESEPGTFKDRVLMESDPFAVIEGMAIAGTATGCEQGYLYVRGEYPLARHRIEHAIVEARRHGFLGIDIEGSGLTFDIEVRRGAGAYICGEETALFNSIEGKRGEPRNKPPFPVQVGLFGKPTLVNNVETLVNVLDIVNEGGGAYAKLGTPDSTGTRLFCLSGHVRAPGLYEVPMGTTLRVLIEMAGGLREGRSLRAVLLGGAAGSFVTESQLDVPLSFEGTRAIGATLGSGAVIVFDDTAELGQVLLRIARFFRDESCGQCVPCRVGTVRQEEALKRILSERDKSLREQDIALLSDIAQAMRDASICGLGQTAASAIGSAVIQLKMVGGRG
jgi:NADH-quinone oxidoreductase subunit F